MIARLLALLLAAALPPQQPAAKSSIAGWVDPSPHAVRFAELPGVRLHYLDWGGRGSALVFLPGLGQSAHIFDGLAPRFSSDHRVLALTTRGAGKSGRPALGYGTTELVEDLRQVLDALQISRAILAGHSMAGNELTAFALAYPNRIEKLIYIEAAYDFSRMPPPGEDPVHIEKPSAADLADVPAGMRWFERVFGFSSPAVEADARDVNLTADGTLRAESAPPEIGKQLWEAMVSYKPDYSRIRAPILAIYAFSASHPFLRADSDPALREKGNQFWRAKWIPYQEHSVGQLLRAGGPVQITILRNTHHLCFIRKSDEERVVRWMHDFLR